MTKFKFGNEKASIKKSKIKPAYSGSRKLSIPAPILGRTEEREERGDFFYYLHLPVRTSVRKGSQATGWSVGGQKNKA